nr:hypothetical protein [Tanacetum cinerariifolium]
MREIAIRELRKKLEIAQKEKDGIQLNVNKFKHASKSLNKLIECQIVNNCKKGLGYEYYNAVAPPYTRNCMPPIHDLSFTSLDEFVNKPVVENYKAKYSEEESKVVRKNDAPIIEEYVSDNEEEDVSQPKIEKKTVRPGIVKKERIHNIHKRSTSPFHPAKEDLRLGNLKFFPKGEVDEVFRMHIPNELILNNIRNAPYYNSYLEMVAKHDRKVAAEKEGKKNTTSAKTPKSKPDIEKSSKPKPAPKPKATKERPSKASTAKPPKPKPAKEKLTKTTLPLKAGNGKIAKVCKVKSPFQLVDEPDEEPDHSEPEPELIHQGEG